MKRRTWDNTLWEQEGHATCTACRITKEKQFPLGVVYYIWYDGNYDSESMLLTAPECDLAETIGSKYFRDEIVDLIHRVDDSHAGFVAGLRTCKEEHDIAMEYQPYIPKEMKKRILVEWRKGKSIDQILDCIKTYIK